MKIRHSFTALLLLTLAACSPNNASLPEIKSLKIHAGDSLSPQAVSAELSAQIKADFDCQPVENPPYLEGLQPNPPKAACQVMELSSSEAIPKDALRLDPTFLSTRWYKIFVPEGASFKVLESFAALKAAYAPVESPAEALSFVLLKEARSGLLRQDSVPELTGDNLQFLTEEAEGTQTAVLEAGNEEGFEVLHVLLDSGCNGQENETTAYSVDFQVSSTGDIREIRRTPLYITKNCPIE